MREAISYVSDYTFATDMPTNKSIDNENLAHTRKGIFPAIKKNENMKFSGK